MDVSEAYIDIMKGREQLGPHRTCVVETFCFCVSQAIWQESEHSNSAFLDIIKNRGQTLLKKYVQTFYNSTHNQQIYILIFMFGELVGWELPVYYLLGLL